MSFGRKRRLRLSIRSMMLVIVVVALLLAPLVWVQRNRERAILAELARAVKAESLAVRAIAAERENEKLRLKIKALEQAKEQPGAETERSLQKN